MCTSVRWIAIAALALLAALSAWAGGSGRRTLENPGSVRLAAHQGYSWYIDDDGETIAVIHLHRITCYPPQKFKNKKDEQYYWRTVRNVRVTLPYAKLIGETLIETYEYIETFATTKEREAYLKRMESSLFKQYKPVLKRFSRSQAKILIKLIQRETNQSSYDIVKAFLGSFRATFWQGFGRLFGVSLKSSYDPAHNHDDAVIDRIATLIEEGAL